jgi:photosystem II stability/assembly factor-like uncharacterized protein
MKSLENWMRRRLLFLFSLFAAAWGLAAAPLTAQAVDEMDRPAVDALSPTKAVYLDVTMAGSRIVAVGERGLIICSDDHGRTWRQASVPTSVSLTRVRFATPVAGWAVGHSGVVLHTVDGGQTWSRQLDGRSAAQLAVDAAQADAQRADPGNAEAQRALTDAQRLVSDGPDKPFLNLLFKDDKTGYVVGAYGLIFKTEDGGTTWKSWMGHVDNPRGMHIYSIAEQGDTMYMAGEQGLFLRSTDHGNKFMRVETPYKGTYFTLTLLPAGEIILGGMKGNAYRSTDQGRSFTKVDVPIPVSLSAAAVMSDGTLVFANQAGMLLASQDKGVSLRPLPSGTLPPIAGVADEGHGVLLTVGYGGVIPVPVGTMTSSSQSGGAK